MTTIRLDNKYILKASVIEVLYRLRLALTNGKLRDIKEDTENIVVSCPAHGNGLEAHPACNIYVGSDSEIPYGYFNCFVCGTKGTFLKFVALCFDSSEDFARAWLLKNFNSEIIPTAMYLGEPIVLNRPKKKRTIILDEQVLDTYQSWHPYLGERKLSREVCEKFKVRYDPYFRQIIFPAYDIFGNLVMLPKRSIDTKSFYLDKEFEKPVYCLDTIIKEDYKWAVITEGPFDTLTGWEYGYPTCGTFGTISEYQIEQLNLSGIRTFYAAFDNDEAGRIFTRILKTRLRSGIVVREVQLPKGRKDLNELTREEFNACLQKAMNSQEIKSYNIKGVKSLQDKIKKYNLNIKENTPK